MLNNSIHRPNISEWPKRLQTKWTVAEILAMPRSKADAKATLGEPATFYYRGKLCNARKHYAPQYTIGGRCVVCKLFDNKSRTNRERRKVEGLDSATTDAQQKQKSLGVSSMVIRGVGSAKVYPLFMTPGPEALAALKAGLAAKLAMKPRDRNGVAISGWCIDHSVHIGLDLPEGVLIVGREVDANRKLMTTTKNNAKANRLPDPNEWSRAADRPLSIAEQAEFVRLGVAVWSHDLVWDDGKLIGVRRELYVDDPVTGLTTYMGQEPA